MYIKSNIEEIYKWVSSWNSRLELGLKDHGKTDDRAAWTIDNLLIVAEEVAPDIISYRSYRYGEKEYSQPARDIMQRLQTLLKAHFEKVPIKEVPFESEIVSKETLSHFPESKSSNYEVRFEETIDELRKEHPDMSEFALKSMAFTQLNLQIGGESERLRLERLSEVKERERIKNMTAELAAAEFLGVIIRPTIHNSISEAKEDEVSRKRRNRGPSAEILEKCRIAMKAWLDNNQSLNRAAQLAGCDDQTVLRRIPDVLESLEDAKRETWIRLVRVQGKEKYLGRFRDHKKT